MLASQAVSTHEVTMVLRSLFGGGHAPASPADAPATPADAPASGGDTESIRRIVAELDALPLEQRRFVAGFAYVLARAAHADLEIRPGRAGLHGARGHRGRAPQRRTGRPRRGDGAGHERAVRTHGRLRRDAPGRRERHARAARGPPPHRVRGGRRGSTPSAPPRRRSSTRSARSWASEPTRSTPSATSSATSSPPSRPCARHAEPEAPCEARPAALEAMPESEPRASRRLVEAQVASSCTGGAWPRFTASLDAVRFGQNRSDRGG